MTVTLTSTTKVITLIVNGAEVRARLWEGETSKGVTCHAFITRIAHLDSADATEFERDLKRHQSPSAALDAIPLRMII
jgi:hypothetical protein